MWRLYHVYMDEKNNVIRLKQKDLDNKRLMHLYQQNVSVILWKDGFIGGGNQIEKIADV